MSQVRRFIERDETSRQSTGRGHEWNGKTWQMDGFAKSVCQWLVNGIVGRNIAVDWYMYMHTFISV